MRTLNILLLAGVLLAPHFATAADAKGDPKGDLKALIEKVRTAVQSGKRTAKALSNEMKEFDVLLKKYEGQKSDEVADILFMKAMLHVEVFEDIDTAIPLVQQVKKDFPETKTGKDADRILEVLAQKQKSERAQSSLQVGKVFPDFDEKDLSGKPLSVGRLKGKVVLVDFWATWCGPCIAEMPNVIKAYTKYQSDGFEVIGISFDSDRDRLEAHIKKSKMPWAQYFDGLGWKNKLGQKYGINSIPATFLIGRDGKIVGKNLRGPALEAAVGKALAEK